MEVTLRRPPPLERDLELQLEGGSALLTNGGKLIAEARSATLDVEPPEAPSLERAAASCAVQGARPATVAAPSYPVALFGRMTAEVLSNVRAGDWLRRHRLGARS